jgi:CBS domain-containing protein
MAMTPNPHAIEASEGSAAAHALMERLGVRHLLVMRGERLCGVLSQRELAPCHAFLRGSPGEIGPSLDSLCSGTPLVVSPDDALDVLTEEMETRRLGSAVVVEDGKPVGIVTTTDLCRVLTVLLRGELR